MKPDGGRPLSKTAKQQRLLGYRREAKWELLGSDNVPSADNAGFKGHYRLLSGGFRVTAACTLWGDLQSFAVFSTATHRSESHRVALEAVVQADMLEILARSRLDM